MDSDTDSVVGISPTEDGNTNDNVKNVDTIVIPESSQVVTAIRLAYDESESEEIPDPFSDNEHLEIEENFVLPMVTSAANLINVEDMEDEDENESVEHEKEKDPGFTPIFVPSMSYLAQVPASMQP